VETWGKKGGCGGTKVGLRSNAGAGAMKDYDKCMPPWNVYNRSIANVVIKDGVTTIGGGGFGSAAAKKSSKIENVKDAVCHITVHWLKISLIFCSGSTAAFAISAIL
jgi:hypothetical protein